MALRRETTRSEAMAEPITDKYLLANRTKVGNVILSSNHTLFRPPWAGSCTASVQDEAQLKIPVVSLKQMSVLLTDRGCHTTRGHKSSSLMNIHKSGWRHEEVELFFFPFFVSKTLLSYHQYKWRQGGNENMQRIHRGKTYESNTVPGR